MKKKGLVVWTTLAIISIVVLVVGFAFSGIAECVGLYTSYAESLCPGIPGDLGRRHVCCSVTSKSKES